MNRNAFRFSIATVLFVNFVLAGTFAGYRAGFSEGYASGKAKRQSEESFSKVYEIGELMRSASDHNAPEAEGEQLNIYTLIDVAQRVVHPDEWEHAGGLSSMTPLPWLESLVVYATPSTHSRLDSLFADLATVKLAVADAKKETEAMRRAREEMITRALEPVEKILSVPLEPIAAGVNLVGSWEVQPGSGDGHTRPVRYTFIDKDTVAIASSEGRQPTETWYMTSPASVVISGTAYIAAWATDQKLVLIKHNAPNTFLVANREGEQTDEREPK